ncbi:MAG: MerR family transcriptional regulator [Bacteroidales bacterium]|jgi:DNA-binding transcriptional MerR regulator|nr:MerR family transcriptional regulator [Bacteroidales bacterium]
MPYREKKTEKLFYQIGEVAEMFSEPVSTIRFWEKEFDILKPKKNNKGNRLFMPEDIKNLRLIHHLLRERGMTLDGARKYLKSGREEADYRLEIADTLRNIREMLLEIRGEIN